MIFGRELKQPQMWFGRSLVNQLEIHSEISNIYHFEIIAANLIVFTENTDLQHFFFLHLDPSWGLIASTDRFVLYFPLLTKSEKNKDKSLSVPASHLISRRSLRSTPARGSFRNSTMLVGHAHRILLSPQIRSSTLTLLKT